MRLLAEDHLGIAAMATEGKETQQSTGGMLHEGEEAEQQVGKAEVADLPKMLDEENAETTGLSQTRIGQTVIMKTSCAELDANGDNIG